MTWAWAAQLGPAGRAAALLHLTLLPALSACAMRHGMRMQSKLQQQGASRAAAAQQQPHLVDGLKRLRLQARLLGQVRWPRRLHGQGGAPACSGPAWQYCVAR